MRKLNLGIFQEYIQSFDIICITETKNKTISTDEIYGYKCINHRTGGIYGISILVKDNLNNDIKCLDESQSENVLWISIKHLSIIVGAVIYHRNTQKIVTLTHLMTLLMMFPILYLNTVLVMVYSSLVILMHAQRA